MDLFSSFIDLFSYNLNFDTAVIYNPLDDNVQRTAHTSTLNSLSTLTSELQKCHKIEMKEGR